MSPVGAELMLLEHGRLRAFPEEERKKLVEKFYHEQPALRDYLAECINELRLEQEKEEAIALAVAAWLAMSRVHGARLRKVSPDLILSIQMKNFHMLRELEESGESEWLESAWEFERNQASEKLFKSNQQELECYCLATILVAGENSGGRTHQQAAFEFVFLKTIIQCLDGDPGAD